LSAVVLGVALIDFLRQLAQHPDRDWLRARSTEHQADVVEPLRKLLKRWVESFGPLIPGLAPDAARRGLLRVYRDARFVRPGTSPFHRRVGVQLRHRASSAHAPAPSVTLHLEPAASRLTIGLPRPGTGTMGPLRAAMLADPVLWSQLAASMQACGGEWIGKPGRLSRAQSVAPECLHPFLSRPVLAVSWPVSDAHAASSDLTAWARPYIEAAAPLLRFQCLALGLDATSGSTARSARGTGHHRPHTLR